MTRCGASNSPSPAVGVLTHRIERIKGIEQVCAARGSLLEDAVEYPRDHERTSNKTLTKD